MHLGENQMNKKTAKRITELLNERAMTQKQLSIAADVTESAISHYLHGDRVPRGVNLMKIAKALGTTTDYLLGEEDNEMQEDFKTVKTLIARNAGSMTKAEKMELVGILMGDD